MTLPTSPPPPGYPEPSAPTYHGNGELWTLPWPNGRVIFAPDGPGFWYPPTVLAPVEPTAPAWREEIFGPVVAVVPFDTEDQAVALANDTEYGLSGSIWTENLGRAFRVARGVEAGNLSVNSNSSVRYWTPFGGMKQSGLGRELGPDALDSFTDVKNVFLATD